MWKKKIPRTLVNVTLGSLSNESEASGLVSGSVPDLGLLRPATRLLPHGQAGRPVGGTQFSGLQFHHEKEHSPLTGGGHEFSPVHMVPLSPILGLLGCPFPATFVDPFLLSSHQTLESARILSSASSRSSYIQDTVHPCCSHL